MAYTVRKLITNSWYLSGIVSRRFQAVSGSQISNGLDLLNAVITFKTARNRLIPYFTKYDFNTVVGQEIYFVPNLLDLETITFNLQTVVRFPLERKTRKQYLGSYRVNDTESLMGEFHIERVKGGSNIFMYYLPNAIYPVTIYGKFSLSTVTLDQDLELTMEQFYIDYLRYALAEYICDDQQRLFPPNAAQKLKEYEQTIVDISPIDFLVGKKSTLQKQSGLNWAQVNFPGWTT
jgi:hypothetical protein